MSPPVDQSESGSFRDFLALLKQNPFGYYGFLCSLVQLAVHAGWLTFVSVLAGSAEAADLDGSSWQMWVIVGLIIIGGLLTAVGLFLSLYGAIHGRPKTAAVVGLCLSFFVGSTVTFVLLLNLLSG
ncbi:MAG: hypothetical protein Fues2KO_18830 [Fuerstiella sp.]